MDTRARAPATGRSRTRPRLARLLASAYAWLMRHGIAGLVIAFLVLSIALGALERRFAAIPQASIWHRARATDFAYWLFTPLVARALRGVALVVVIGAAAILLGLPRSRDALLQQLQTQSPLSKQPAALQLIEALLLADLISYWTHRAFHTARLWRIHAVHHSSTALDWLSATRLHPLNDVASKLCSVVPLVFLGFDLRIFAAVVPILTFWAIFVHANLNWGFGPLRYAIATPLFHRWHHTSQAEGLDKNFAGLFPLYDLIFGTLYLPKDRVPEIFGVSAPVPQNLLGQLAWPFRKT